VAFEIHVDQRCHRWFEQLARELRGGWVAAVDKDDMPTTEQLGVGPKHRMNRRDAAASSAQLLQAFAKRTFERANVEHHARWRCTREVLQDRCGDRHRCGYHSDLVIEG
jgi:hypothetical protein